MSELRDPTRETLSATVRALVKRHGGPTAVGDLVGAHRLTVNRWMKGDIGLDKLGLLAETLGEPITVSFGPTTKEAAPSMTRRLLAGVIALERRADISPDELLSAQDSAAAIEAALEVDARLAAELEASRRTSGGRAGGRGGGQGAGSQGSKRQTP